LKPEHKKTCQQYLTKYSQAIDLITFPGSCCWDHVLIIPVCGESPEFLSQVCVNQMHASVLIIVILNRPSNHEKSEQWKLQNQKILTYFTQEYPQQIPIYKEHVLYRCGKLPDVLLLDFNDAPFESKKGVGLARKIAADTALSLWYKGVITQPWIFSTDADVVLPQGYFQSVSQITHGCSALSLNFKHYSNQIDALALQSQYDFKLRYYQASLKFMGVNYDYIPLGSTLVIHVIAYAQVRGFPCRSGGEDFYILNKLAKVGRIEQPDAPVVNIKIRFSDRVPFGTGPAVTQLQQQAKQGEAVCYYHPRVFHILKAWRTSLLGFYSHKSVPDDSYGLNGFWSIDSVLEKGIKQINSQLRWQQFIHEWFDAFKILKSVHFLRNEFKSLTADELQASDFYIDISDYY